MATGGDLTSMGQGGEAAISPEQKAPIMIGGNGALQLNDLGQIYSVAGMLVRSGFAPRDIDTPEKATIILLHGREVGLSPMVAIQRIAVINGRPSIWGDALLGLCEATNQLDDFEETYAGTPGSNDYRAICRAVRNRPGGKIRRTTNEFSIGDAKTAGLWLKKGPWTTNPKRMLKMRARGFSLRDLFSDVMSGLYMSEEVIDIGIEEDNQGFSVSEISNETPLQPEPDILQVAPAAQPAPEEESPSSGTESAQPAAQGASPEEEPPAIQTRRCTKDIGDGVSTAGMTREQYDRVQALKGARVNAEEEAIIFMADIPVKNMEFRKLREDEAAALIELIEGLPCIAQSEHEEPESATQSDEQQSQGTDTTAEPSGGYQGDYETCKGCASIIEGEFATLKRDQDTVEKYCPTCAKEENLRLNDTLCHCSGCGGFTSEKFANKHTNSEGENLYYCDNCNR